MSTVSDDDAKLAVCRNMHHLLQQQGRTLYWLMQQIDMSPGALYPIAKGQKIPSVGTASRIAAALGVTVDDLLRLPKKSKVSA